MKIELIINQAAGGGKPEKVVPEVENILQTFHLPYHISWTSSPGGAVDLAKEAAERGTDIVVSVGGDGTINEIVNGLLPVKKDLVPSKLGIIPAGWANDFIKSTTIPNDVEKACQIIKNGKIQKIDTGLINEEIYFLNVFGIGFDAEIAALANQIKTNHPHWKTLSAYVYVFATIRKLLSPLPSFQAKITIDQQVIEGEILFLAIANGKVEGGKFNIAPDAKIDDGLFDICIVRKMGRLRCLHLLPTVIKGTHQHLKEVSFFKGKEILVETDRPVISQVAGEKLPAQNKFHIKVLPKTVDLLTN